MTYDEYIAQQQQAIAEEHPSCEDIKKNLIYTKKRPPNGVVFFVVPTGIEPVTVSDVFLGQKNNNLSLFSTS